MWLLFGNRTKAQPVPGGRSEDRDCPQCRTRRPFVECDVADQVSIFFVPILSGSTRRMVCTVCGEDLAVEQPSTGEPEQQQSEPAPKRRPTDRELEDQLKAMKKRMKK
jgi:hypothetical protein